MCSLCVSVTYCLKLKHWNIFVPLSYASQHATMLDLFTFHKPVLLIIYLS